MIIVVCGSEYSATREVAKNLELRDRVMEMNDVIVVNDIFFVKRMVKAVEDANNKLLIIHMNLPKDKLVKRIMMLHPNVPLEDAQEIAEDDTKIEAWCDFDNSIPDDMMLITYTGESNIPIEQFCDICESLIMGEDIGEYETHAVLEENSNGYKRS